MTQEGTLTALREGERARVAALLTEGGMRRRMQDIGLIDRPPSVLPHAGRKPYNAVFQNERLAQKLFHVSS